MERWQELAEIAHQEQDPAKLLALISEINRLLDLERQPPPIRKGSPPPSPTNC